MTKKFDNLALDGVEKALRRGFTVPDGAVNVAWVKSPKLSPSNNIVIIDTSKVVSENQAISGGPTAKLAFANALGVLEDVYGNHVWDEEYPVISDVFLGPDQVVNNQISNSQILPYVHVSRHFHLDYAGLASSKLEFHDDLNIRVVRKDGVEHVDDNGKQRYKIYLVQPSTVNPVKDSRQSVYRVYAFIDMDPEVDELYLSYYKAELSRAGGLKKIEQTYRERVNPRSYYNYIPEESDVFDLSNKNSKIYSSKPVNVKEQILGKTQSNAFGWKYTVPRKAIPDPRIFQLFRWRLACEFTQVKTDNGTTGNGIDTSTGVIRAGVVIPSGGDHNSNRANYFFYQLNESDYNFSKIKFVNPISSPNLSATKIEQQAASYWHVDLKNIDYDALADFDVLIWAPNGINQLTSDELMKITYFTENVGGTFIYETSGITNFSNMLVSPGITPSLGASKTAPNTPLYATVSTLRLKDNSPGDEFNTLGVWQKWPPNVGDILNSYNDIGSILSSADVIAGWNMTTNEKNSLSTYKLITGTCLQYFTDVPSGFTVVAEAQQINTTTYQPTLIHKKFNSGGNVFISTTSLFEDHLINPNSTMASKSLNVANINQLSQVNQLDFKQMVSSQAVAGEMKFRFNTMLFATVNKPSPVKSVFSKYNFIKSNTQSTTIYGDWESTWVINPANGVLSDVEKAEANFALLPTKPNDLDPVWQRVLSTRTLEQIIKDKLKKVDPEDLNGTLRGLESAQRRYFIMVTNPMVQVLPSNSLTDTSLPTAWTTAYSPAFTVPAHLGSYVIRDEMIAGTGVGNGKRIYPPKPYELQASVSYFNNSTIQGKTPATINCTGSYKITYTTDPVLQTNVVTTTQQVYVPGTADTQLDVVLHWNTDGGNAYTTGYKHQGGTFYNRPVGIETYTDSNYDLAGTNWPYWGVHGTLVSGAASGASVLLVQRILNQLIFFQLLGGPYLAEDGVYGPVTSAKVKAFQVTRGAHWIDGVVDAETWSLLGYALDSLSSIPGWNQPNLNGFAAFARGLTRLGAISDGSTDTPYVRQSWQSNGPSTIRETFLIKFNETLTVYRVAISPYTALSATNNITLDWLDISPRTSLYRYPFTTGFPGNIVGVNGSDGVWLSPALPSPMATNSIVFRLTETGTAGWGTARLIGIRDVQVFAKKLVPGTPGYYKDVTTTSTVTNTIPGTTYEVSNTFTFNQTLDFQAGVKQTLYPGMGVNTGITLGHPASSIKWDLNGLTITPPEIANFFTVNFVDTSSVIDGVSQSSNKLELTYNGYQNILGPETFVQGPDIGAGQTSYYTKNVNGEIDPYARTYGWINKEDGIRLICYSDGRPFGFPAAFPSQVTNSTHFTRFNLNAYNIDQTIQYGFYDILRKEWITNTYGEPEVSYYDYVRRGPQNVFIAVQTTYELDTSSNLPGSTDPVRRPFKWAMPVYGVLTGTKSKIQIEPLSPDLGVDDIWALPVKTGSFSRKIQMPARIDSGSLTNYLKNYQGSTLTAYYSLPEARNNAWSSSHGRPYIDVRGEIPIIIDDNIIKVRQNPILIAENPTAIQTDADPWYPVFTVYTRKTITDKWTKIPFNQIEDYDAWNGTIKLVNPLNSNDPRLVKVDYTSQRKTFQLKHDGTTQVNLNPYVASKSSWLNKALYIYIIPEYIVDSNNTVIPESKMTRTLKVTENSSIFDPIQPEYDISAIMLGIVYTSTSFNIDDLSILDTRKRGGGANFNLTDKELATLQPEFDSYFDINPRRAVSYQQGGFVTIRLPAGLKNDFTYDDIKKVIERNLTIGVAYKVEDLNGNRWDV